MEELSLRREVITLILSGDQDLKTLQQLAENARSGSRKDPNVTQIQVIDVPDPNGIEVPSATLEAHGLTLDDIATQIRIASLSYQGVSKQRMGRFWSVADRKKSVADFKDLIIRSSFEGAELRLGDIASITDGYTDTDEESYYNGKRAVRPFIV